MGAPHNIAAEARSVGVQAATLAPALCTAAGACARITRHEPARADDEAQVLIVLLPHAHALPPA